MASRTTRPPGRSHGTVCPGLMADTPGTLSTGWGWGRSSRLDKLSASQAGPPAGQLPAGFPEAQRGLHILPSASSAVTSHLRSVQKSASRPSRTSLSPPSARRCCTTEHQACLLSRSSHIPCAPKGGSEPELGPLPTRPVQRGPPPCPPLSPFQMPWLPCVSEMT